MSVKSEHMSIGDLVLIDKRGSGIVTGVLLSEIETKKYAGPVVRVLIDGEEKFITTNNVRRIANDES